jgi:phage tail-like protein
LGDVTDPATNCRFRVEVDVDEQGQTDLGAFTECEGLGAEYELKPIREGGENGFIHQIPGALKFDTVRLHRPINAKSAAVASWFSGMRDRVERTTARITALDPAGGELATWTLVDVYPKRWTGPSFTTKGQDVAKETLELVHNGFVTDVPALSVSISVALTS